MYHTRLYHEATQRKQNLTQNLLADWRQTFLQIGKRIGINQPEEWYFKLPNYRNLVTSYPQSVKILRYFGNSPTKALIELFPDYNFKPWLFHHKVSAGFWKDLQNQKDYFEWLGKKLHITSLEQWIDLKKSDIDSNGGATLLKMYNYSPIQALKAIYPQLLEKPRINNNCDTEIKPWEYNRVPKGFWNDVNNQRDFLKWAETKLGISNPESWYEVSDSTLVSLGGSRLLALYKSSLPNTIMSVFPHYSLKRWLFSQPAPSTFWRQMENQKEFFDWYGDRHGITFETKEKWYQVSYKELVNSGARPMLELHEHSPAKALLSVYPEYDLKPWLFNRIPNGLWTSRETQRRFFDWLATQLHIDKPEHWLSIRLSQVISICGSATSLLALYEGSLSKALIAVYPEHDFKPWNFDRVSRRYWSIEENRRAFFDWLGRKLSIQSTDEWYRVSQADIARYGGSSLIKEFYRNSPSLAIMSVYSKEHWNPWKFKALPRGWWSKEENVRQYMDWLSTQFQISRMEEWYRVSTSTIKSFGGDGLLHKYRGLGHLLAKRYSDFKWDMDRHRQFGKSQYFLYKLLCSLFEGYKVLYDFTHPTWKFKATGMSMQFDVCIPEFSLLIEYQGIQHYSTIPTHTKSSGYYLFGSGEQQRMRDEEKRQKCKEEGLILIEIPYWWDYSKGALLATIFQQFSQQQNCVLNDGAFFTGAPLPEKLISLFEKEYKGILPIPAHPRTSINKSS